MYMYMCMYTVWDELIATVRVVRSQSQFPRSFSAEIILMFSRKEQS